MEDKYIYLVRHGQTNYNKMRIVQGSGVDTSINEMGERQAEAFYKAYKDIAFDAVYISALRRTYQSVKSFIRVKNLPFTPLVGLNEISWGIHEGKVIGTTNEAQYRKLLEDWDNGLLDSKLEKGESPLEVQERQKAAWQHILQKTDEKNILICMHGRAMRIFICSILGVPLTEMSKFKHQNLCLYKFKHSFKYSNKYSDAKVEMILENDTKHLEHLPSEDLELIR